MSTGYDCIFCGGALDENTKSEHLIQNCIGGKVASRTITCTTCNEHFSTGPDSIPMYDEEVGLVFASVMNVLNPLLPSNASGAVIGGRDKDGEYVKLESGRTFHPKMEVEKDPVTGKPIAATGIESQLRKKAPMLAAAHGKSGDDVEFTHIDKHPAPKLLFHRVPIYTPSLARAFLKSTLQMAELLFRTLRSERLVGAGAFEQAVRYARYGEEAPALGLIDNTLHHFPLAAPVWMDKLEEVDLPHRNFAHSAAMICSGKDIVGVFLPFGIEAWVFHLSDSFDGDDGSLLFTQSVLKGEMRHHFEIPQPLLTQREIEKFRPQKNSGWHRWRAMRQMSEARIRLFRDAVGYVEMGHPSFAMNFIYGDKQTLPAKAFLDALEQRLKNYFDHSEGWKSEWPGLFQVFRSQHFDDMSVDVPRLLGEELYSELFCLCTEYVGPPLKIVRGRLSPKGGGS